MAWQFSFYVVPLVLTALALMGLAVVSLRGRIENVRLLEAERARLRLAQTLQAVGALLTSEYSLQDVLERLLDFLSDVVHYDSASIQLLDATNTLRLVAGRGFDDLALVDKVIRESSAGIIARFQRAETSGVLIISDVHTDPSWVLASSAEPIRSWIGAPLLIKGRLIGTLNVDRLTPNAFDEEMGQTVMAFANQAAIAIENARLYGEVQEALRIREQVLQNVSHELRTPLTIIHGYADFMRDHLAEETNDLTRQGLDIILEQSQHLTVMVEQLLAVQESEIRSMYHERFSASAWLQKVVLGWTQVLAAKSISLRFQIASDVAEVFGDRRYLNQVLNNLLDNASKFSGEGSEIWLRAWREQDDIHIAVSDQGVGVPPDRLPHIFERFYQVRTENQPRYKGLGLGLALARDIVEKHGGRIWAESEGEGQGTTVEFTLPAAV